ncbi:MAG: 2Fe-2S iron-sulfur cluster-binding protein [Planctomycetaceae bacterium]
MPKRLPPQPGEWLDRNRTVAFRFEGKTYHGFVGDMLSSALWANDVRLLGRSFKYHRPRGVYSLSNHDVNLMVEDGRRTNLRGDVLPITPGLDVRAVNTVGGLKRDRLRIIDRFGAFLPVGFYYKAFHTPRRLFRFYENQMRKIAGLGKIEPSARWPASPKDYAFCDLLVVGAGPAGLAGAIAAAENGLHVLLVDEQQRPGGSLTWQWAGDAAARERLRELLERASMLDNLEMRCATQAGGWYADHWVALFNDRRLTKLRAGATLVATGCIEQPAVFYNNDLPGVMLASAAQRLMHIYAVKPCDRAVVLAANSDGYRLACDLYSAGVDVAAVVDLRREGDQTEMSRRVAEAGIAIHRGHAVYEAVANRGKTVVKATICPLNDDGSPRTDSTSAIDCDGIMMSVGWAPNSGLVSQAGGRFRYATHVEQFIPSELPPGVFAAGRLNGVFDLQDQIADGRRAGLAAAAFLGKIGGTIPEALVHRSSPPSHPYPIFTHPKKKNFVDLDEDLHLADFVNAHQEGYDNIELMKRYTTVGMGPSQGKLSNMNAVRILARLNGASIDATGSTTSRPFHQPVSLGHLAGRRFHPLRRTPMHEWHAQAGAEIIHAGDWFRPEYYRVDGRTRDDCIYEEAANVRRNVSLIDVGTLGKLHVMGPDAARFLEHIYTGRFENQKTGTLRYGLACDETGVIIEDGVVARLDDDCFYVTATSSGVAAFYREMQRWAIIFKMNVALVNATGQLAAMNIAGPKSREVIKDLTDVDLSPEQFGYLGVRRGTVAGARATLMRVGFVGELGYEIHVPASHGWHVWNVLIEAGRRYDIRPFGIEAQRLLRLEKGHFIVGHDTDALTTPFEADVAWAIGKNKDFFVGGRSLDIIRKKPLTRTLVGIVFPQAHRGPFPEECNLIIAAGEIAGRVTSIARRTTLGFPIGMAFVRPDLANPGTNIEIRVDDGNLVAAQVARLPFYDPGNGRQR